MHNLCLIFPSRPQYNACLVIHRFRLLYVAQDSDALPCIAGVDTPALHNAVSSSRFFIPLAGLKRIRAVRQVSV